MEYKTRKATMEDCQVCIEPPGCSTKPLPCNIEVPEERIAVGDLVREGDDGPDAYVVAISEEADVTEQSACIRLHCDGSLRGIYRMGWLTLIRKGPEKHVFEGVMWRDIPCPEDAFGETSACVPHSSVPEQGLIALCDNGKTYRMEMTEEAE